MKKFLKVVCLSLMVLIALIFTLPYAFSVQENIPNDSFKPFPESHFVKVEGVRIHYREWIPAMDSSKGNVLLIHGFSGSTFSWRKNIDTLLHSGYRVVAADVPPFGYSSKEKKINHSTTANAQLLWKLADSLSSSSWIIAGHSMGASIAGAMAAMRPDKTKKLILVDGSFDDVEKSNRVSFLGWLVSTGPVKRLAEVIAKKRFYNYAKFKELLTSAYAKAPDSLSVVGYLEPFKIKRSASAILELSRSKEIRSLFINDIRSPVLVIWGSKDSWIPIDAGRKFIKDHPSAKLEVIEGAGHCSMETDPNDFNKRMIDFINKDQ